MLFFSAVCCRKLQVPADQRLDMVVGGDVNFHEDHRIHETNGSSNDI